MIQVDRSLFSNVISSVQRTSNLPGGGVNGLPNGIIIRGLEGVSSFGSDIQDAQKEFEKGRVRSSLERVRQLDTLFQGIVGRWNSTVNTLLSSARTGTQQISIQKLNEVKQAQTKMQQLTRPASKALQDLVTALELALTNEGRKEIVPSDDDEKESDSNKVTAVEQATPKDESISNDHAEPTTKADDEEEEEHPDIDLLGRFSTNYRFANRLEIKKGSDGKSRIDPNFEANGFYFFHGMDPPRVIRIREIRRGSLLVFDTYYSQETNLELAELKPLLANGIWQLQPKKARP